MPEDYEYIPGRFGYSITRTGDASTAGRVPLDPSLRDDHGAMLTSAILMGIDMTCGMAAGLAVLPNWTVTADAEVHFVGPCRIGPLRVDAVSIRAGRTMSVVDVRVVDEGAEDALVAIATANHGVLESNFEHRLATAPLGTAQRFARPEVPVDESLEEYFGLKTEGETLSLPLDSRTTNPWGIFHGGLSGFLVDKTVRAIGFSHISDVNMRFLNPVRKDAAVARVGSVVTRGDERIARVEIRDGVDGRLAVLGHVVGH